MKLGIIGQMCSKKWILPSAANTAVKPSSVANTIAKRGFTLIELMIVVAIVGILAAVAISNFEVFQCRTKQTEAKTGLRALYLSQKVYRAETDTYATGAAANTLIGSSIVGVSRYVFTFPVATTTTFTAQANGLSTTTVALDIWTIDENNQLLPQINTCVN